MKIIVLGLSHKTAPVAVREQLSFPGERIPHDLSRVTALESVREAMILSTCNRVEIYLASRAPEHALAQLTEWLADHANMDPAQLEPHLYRHVEESAIRHGFRVAASLDSMIVGEPQILGQLKEAYQKAVSAGTIGLVLHKYFHRAFQVAKRVRSETAIAENPVSIAYAAVELAKKIFGSLDGRTCLLIGAGEMCELAARHLVAGGVRQVLVTNRTFERAVRLAQSFDGHAFPLETLSDNLDRADIVISSTGSTTYMVGPEMVEKALKRRRWQPMFFIDIAVPRDLDPRIAKVDSAFLYDIDDLTQIVEKNVKDRGQAAQQAETIIAQEIPAFVQWLESLDVVPTIVGLRRKMEETRDQELARILATWPDQDEEGRRRLEAFARLLVNKMLHTPTSRLRQLAGEENGELYVDAARKLFEL